MYIGSLELAKLNDVYTKTQADTLLGNKQNTLVSGTSIKTINNQSILGSGNIECVTDYYYLINWEYFKNLDEEKLENSDSSSEE